MISLYEYIQANTVNESDILDLVGQIADIFSTTTGAVDDIIDNIIKVRDHNRENNPIKHKKEVERILLYLLNDKEVAKAIQNKHNEIKLRILLQQKLDPKDIRYIPDIIEYCEVIKDKMR